MNTGFYTIYDRYMSQKKRENYTRYLYGFGLKDPTSSC